MLAAAPPFHNPENPLILRILIQKKEIASPREIFFSLALSPLHNPENPLILKILIQTNKLQIKVKS